MSEGESTFLEDFESCPMCGHEGITSKGSCVNCGEMLISSDEPDKTESESLNWRLICGPITLVAFSILMIATIAKASQSLGQDRTLFLLFATALGCVALIGLTLTVNGIVILIRRMS